MKKLPTFGHQEIYIVSEDCPEGEELWLTEWSSEIVHVAEWNSWISWVMQYFEEEPYPKFKREYKKISNREYMEKYVYGCPFDDDTSEITRDECPECSHLLVAHDPEEDSGHFCSNHGCAYVDEQFNDYQKREREYKGVTMYLEGEDPHKYAESLGIDIDRHLKVCPNCGKEMGELKCFRTSNGYAGVSAKCDECGNGPATARPVTKSAMAFWDNII